MTSATTGRRPDGPGWYWYDGPVWTPDEGLDAPCRVYWATRPGEWHFVMFPGDETRFPLDNLTGTFTPLSPPPAMPSPDWNDAPEWANWWAVGV